MARVEQSFEAHTKSIDVYGRMLSAEVPYIVFEAIDENDALQAVLDTAPEMLDFNGSQIRLSSIEIDERCNAEVYKVSVSYEKSSGTSESDTADDAVEVSFSTGGGTKHVVIAIEPKAVEGYENTCGNLIGWNGKSGTEAEYDGVDVPDSNSQMTLTVTKRMSELGNKWQRNVDAATGKVNSKKFRGYEPGEVLFEGVSFTGSEKSDSVKVSYNFSIRLNETDVPIATDKNGKVITVSKKGFEYAWVAPRIVGSRSVPQLIRVDKVIEEVDFSTLGI